MLNAFAIDTETFLIEQGCLAPPLVCISFSNGEESDVIHHSDPAAYRLMRWLLESDFVLGGQNMPYDLAVIAAKWGDLLDPIFAAYDADRVTDTMVRQKLIDIARGVHRGYRSGVTGAWIKHDYHLADLAKRHKYEFELDKDTWRLRYAELIDVPVEEWPKEAYDYSYHDARSTFHVLRAQHADEDLLGDQFRQCRAHWALHLMSAWGVRTDPHMVAKLRWLTEQMIEDSKALLIEHGLLKKKKDGTYKKEAKRAAEYARTRPNFRDEAPFITKTGAPSLSEDAVGYLDDPVTTAYQRYASASTILDRVRELEAGTVGPIHTRFDELMVSGRTSSSKPNIQNRATSIMVRQRCEHKLDDKKTKCKDCGKPYHMAGDRESFVPRDGNVFLISDVPGLELRTIAQTCLKIVGHSKLAEILNAGRDPHIEVAATLRGIPVDIAYERKKNPNDLDIYLARQTGKVVNFGLNARLGWRGLILQARSKYGVILNEQEAKEAIEAYYATLPEMRDFHDWVDVECGSSGLGHVIHLFSERQQGLVPPTVMSNTFSQGLGADATKAALYELIKTCYIVRHSPLFGSRGVNYVHDEYHVETREENLDEKSEEMARLICDEANKWLPDVPIPLEEMKPIATRRWSKLAKQKRNADGTLGVWEWADFFAQEAA